MEDTQAAEDGPPPGTLEWLADQDPAAPATVRAQDGGLETRAEHDAAATALAHGLRAEHGVGPGDRVAIALPAAPELLVLPFALAKLGAAPLLLDPARPADAAALAAVAGCRLTVAAGAPAPRDGLLPLGALDPLLRRHLGGERLLSAGHAPVDGVQLAAGRPDRILLRVRTPDRIARLAAPFGDLLRRVALRPGTSVLLGPGAHRPEPQFWAGVALVTGGSVVTTADADPAALLRALAGHGVGAAVLDRATLAALVALPEAVTADADLTALERIVLDGDAPDAALVEACADLFGDDVLHRVAATPQTGAYGHADADALAADPAALTVLDGVAAHRDDDGTIAAVISPLAADGVLGDAAARGGWPAPPEWTDAPVPLSA